MERRRHSSRGTLIFLTCLFAVPTVPNLIYGRPELTNLEAVKPYLLVGAALGFIHLLLRPVLRALTAPLGCLTFGLSGTAIDIALIYFAARLVPGFHAPELLCAALTAFLINAVSTALRHQA